MTVESIIHSSDRKSLAYVHGWIKELQAGGLPNADHDLREIIMSVTGRSMGSLFFSDYRLSDTDLRQIQERIDDRIGGQPLQYITGLAAFKDWDINVFKGTFIPRIETELLSDCAIQLIREIHSKQSVKVIDLGTGTGCIPITIARQCDKASIDAVEISEPAYQCAQHNIQAHHVSDRVHLAKLDYLIQTWPGASPDSYDIVVTNPPYISLKDKDQLSKEVLQEPPMALFGGQRGTEIIEKIFVLSAYYLKSKGYLLVEIGSGQAKYLQSVLNKSDTLKCVDILRDHQGIQRVLKIQKQ